MDEKILFDIGLTRSETKVYLALLEIGSSTTGPIIKKAGIASGKAYLILDKLIMKGLVTHVIKSGVKHYQAKDPEKLVDYLHKKEKELKKKEKKLMEFIPVLKAEYEEAKYMPKAEIYEGVKGFKSFYDWVINDELKKGDEILVMGAAKDVNEKFGGYLWDWVMRKEKKCVKMKILYNHDARKLGMKRVGLKYCKVRFMKPEMKTPAFIDVFNDYVATIIVTGEPIVFLLKNKEAADSYRKYFEVLWEQSDDP